MSKSLLKKGIDHKGVAERGDAIYEAIKGQYEPAHNGKYLAIEVESEDIFLDTEEFSCIELARKKYPNKRFYLARIGFQTAEAVHRERKNTLHTSIGFL